MSGSFLNTNNADFFYKSKVFAGILSKRAFVGPYLVAIGGNYSCNYRCVFCEWFSPMVKKLKKEVHSPDYHMEMDVYKGLVRELGALGTRMVLIGDIEPFMDAQLIEKIEYAKHYNLGVITVTNGSLINEEKAEKLVDLKLDYLSVSINAGTPETYPRIHVTETEETFERIISMVSLIESLKEKKRTAFPHTRLSMVACNRNYHEIVKLVELCKETGVKTAFIKRLIPPSKEIAEELALTHSQKKEMTKYLVEALKYANRYNINLDVEWPDWAGSHKTQVRRADIPCYYGWLFSMVDGNGDVYPCCFQNRIASCKIGNIKKDNFTKLWFSKRYQDFRKNYKNIGARMKTGYLCDKSSCFFNNKQIYEILHNQYLLPFRHIT